MITSNFLNPTVADEYAHRFHSTKIDMGYYWSSMAKEYAEQQQELIRRGDEQNLMQAEDVNHLLWPLVHKLNADKDCVPTINIDSKRFEEILSEISQSLYVSTGEENTLLDRLSWAMLSYIRHFCKDQGVASVAMTIALTYSLENPDDLSAKLFLLGESAGEFPEGFLLLLCESSDFWVVFSMLSCSRVDVTAFTSQMRSKVNETIFLVLDRVATFKKYALLSSDRCATLLGNLVALGVVGEIPSKVPKDSADKFLAFSCSLSLSRDQSLSAIAADVIAIIACQSLSSFVDVAQENLKDSSHSFEKEALYFIKYRGVLAAMLTLDVASGAIELTTLFDVYAQYLSLDFYKALFSLFQVEAESGCYVDPAAQPVLRWVFDLKGVREFYFMNSDVASCNAMLGVIVGLNNLDFNHLLFEGNRCLESREGVDDIATAKNKESGRQVYPFFSALTSFVPGLYADPQVVSGYKKLLMTMLCDLQFKISNYYCKEGVSNYFNNQIEVKLAHQLNSLICLPSVTLESADFASVDAHIEALDVSAIVHDLKVRYSQEIIALSSDPKMSTDGERLKAIFAIVKKLSLESLLELNDQAPHFIILSLANDICECVAVLDAQKTKVPSFSSMYGTTLGITKKPAGKNKIERIHLLIYIKNHLAKALVLATEDKPTFMYLAYFAVHEVAKGELELGRSAKAMLERASLEASTKKSTQTIYKITTGADDLVSQWLQNTIFLSRASTLEFVAKPLAHLPDDYLDGVLQRTTYTKKQIRKMAYPGLDSAVFESQKTFMAAVDDVRASQAQETVAEKVPVR
jgi:hypothetical protein